MSPSNKKRNFKLVEKKSEAENITSLFFTLTDGADFQFFAGQYVNVELPWISGHAKSYTISSVPSESALRITIARKGNFSSALTDMPVGSKLVFDGPHGYFFPEQTADDLVFIAGGIGVTPFVGIINDRLNSGFQNKITLLYSTKGIAQTAFFGELNRLAEEKKIDKLVYFFTEDKSKHKFVEEYERISEKTLKKYLVSVGRKRYYVCGSIGFVRDVWKILKEYGVPEENIFTESFF